MSQTRIARRYAEALLTAAEAGGKSRDVAADMTQLQSLLVQSRDFLLFLRNPVVKREKKREVLSAVFEGKLSELTREFLGLLADKGREDVLPAIVTEFFRLEDERLGIVEVELRAAGELTPEQTAQLQKRFESLTKMNVRIAFRLDPSLKGGFVARLGDTVYDGSVKRQLELLRERFVQAHTN